MPLPEIKVDLTLPPFARQLVPYHRYKVLCGGRGKGATWTTTRMAIQRSLQRKTRFLCTRELQSSIKDSTHQTFADQIELMGLSRWFTITNNEISNYLGSNFVFRGLRHNYREIKSMEGIDVALVEEAEKTTNDSWMTLIPTIRKEKSEIWINLNPDLETDPTYQRFVVNQPPDTLLLKLTYRDNPFFTQTMMDEMEYLKRVDADAYMHVWEGQCRQHSDAQIMAGKWEIDTFEITHGADGKYYLGTEEAIGPYFGLDFGYSQDPTALVRCWLVGKRLFIDYEFYQIKVETVDLPDYIKLMPLAESKIIRADSSRPDTIAHLNRVGGLNVIGAMKGAGSIEAGISYLRSFEKIVIHQRCTHMIQEARLYSWKTDRLTQEITTDILDKHNHLWDAVRYALAPLIKLSGKGMGLFNLMEQQAAEAERQRNENSQR